MTGLLYLLAILASTGCMLLLDWRHKLFFWKRPAAAALVTVAGVAFLLVWDAAGIASGIFLRGQAAVATGIVLAPELPLEEPVFLTFLVICTMVIYTGTARILERLRERP